MSAPPRRDARNLKVAIIEDDPTIRMYLKKLIDLHAEDFSLGGSWRTGEAAVEAVLKTKPCVIVVDQELPGLSGIDWIAEMAPNLPNTAFLVFTVHDDLKTVISAFKAGATGYLLKHSSPRANCCGDPRGW